VTDSTAVLEEEERARGNPGRHRSTYDTALLPSTPPARFSASLGIMAAATGPRTKTGGDAGGGRRPNQDDDQLRKAKHSGCLVVATCGLRLPLRAGCPSMRLSTGLLRLTFLLCGLLLT
jgi:hypothetical protein